MAYWLLVDTEGVNLLNENTITENKLKKTLY
jgi:hypothetical protein